jgi:hypothetical protein
MGLAGRGAASIAAGRAAISGHLNSLKEKAIKEVERDQRLASAAFAEQKLRDAQKDFNSVIIEGQDKGMEWMEQRLRTGMANASSLEEQQMWMQGWLKAKDGVQTETEEDARMSFNSAAMAAGEVVSKLQASLEEDAALKAQLIGDGVGVGERVQNWIMAEAMNASPAAFEIDETLPDSLKQTMEAAKSNLVHQLTEKSYGITKQLVAEYNSKVDEANRQQATSQVAADIQSTITGKQTVDQLEAQIQISSDRYLQSMAPAARVDEIKSSVQKSIAALGSGALGLDNVDDMVQRVADLNELTLEGKPLFNKAERLNNMATVYQGANRVMPSIVAGRIERVEQAHMGDTPNAAGKQDTAAALPDIKDELYAEFGIDPAEMTQEQTVLKAIIDTNVEQVQAKYARELLEITKSERAAASWLTGRPAPDSTTEEHTWKGLPSYAVLVDASTMTRDQQFGLKTDLMDVAEGRDEKLAVMNYQPGETIDLDNAPTELVNVAARHLANQLNQGVGQSKSLIKPANDFLLGQLTGGNNREVEFAAKVLAHASPDDGGLWMTWSRDLPTTESHVLAAAVFARSQILNGSIDWSTGKPTIVEPKGGGSLFRLADMNAIVQGMETIMNTRSTQHENEMLIVDGKPQSARVVGHKYMLGFMAKSFGMHTAEVADVDIDKITYPDQSAAVARGMFAEYASSGMEQMDRLFETIRLTNPNAELDQVASATWAYMHSRGWRVRENERGKEQMYFDPHDYYGVEGRDVTQKVASYLDSAIPQELAVQLYAPIRGEGGPPLTQRRWRDYYRAKLIQEGIITDDVQAEDLVAYTLPSSPDRENMIETPPLKAGGAVFGVGIPAGKEAGWRQFGELFNTTGDMTFTTRAGREMTIRAGQPISMLNDLLSHEAVPDPTEKPPYFTQGMTW